MKKIIELYAIKDKKNDCYLNDLPCEYGHLLRRFMPHRGLAKKILNSYIREYKAKKGAYPYTKNPEDLEVVALPLYDEEMPEIASRLIPIKPLPEKRYYGNGICPNCGAYFLDKSTKYCGNCGQALDWSE